MRSSMATRKQSTSKDRSDSYFFWVIGIVVVTGLAGNFYSKFTESAPSMTTFLDLLTAKKTFYCDPAGKAVNITPPKTLSNCIDYNGYRIVEGDTTFIYEIIGTDHDGDIVLQQAAEMKTRSLKRLFNLKFHESPSVMPDSLWP